MRGARDVLYLRALVDELYSLFERVRASIPVIPPIPPFPSGFGVPLSILGVEMQAHVNGTTGVDAPSTTGSTASPFKTTDYLYRRLAYLSGNAGGRPALVDAGLSTAVPTLHVFLDTPLPLGSGDNNVGLFLQMNAPYGSNVIIDGSPSVTVQHAGALTALAQATNFALNPAHFQVVTLDAVATPFWSMMLVDTQAGNKSRGWIYRAGLNGGGAGNPQIAGANNMNVSSMLSDVVITAGVPMFVSPNQTAAWPNTPTLVTPGGTDTIQIVQLGSFVWGEGGSGFGQRGSLGGSTMPAQITFLNMAFADSGALICSGYGAQASFIFCSFGTPNGPTSIGQAVTMYNCSGEFVSQRALDHYVNGGWITTAGGGGKLGINQADNVAVDAGVIVDGVSITIGTAGGADPIVANVGFYTSNVNTPGIDLSSGSMALGGGAYSNQIGYLITNMTYPFRSSPNTNMSFGFAATFGALAGTPTTIGFYPWPLAIYSTYGAIHDPYSGAFGGTSQGVSTYPVSQKAGVDSAGTALTGALAAQPGAPTQFYTNSVSGLGFDMEIAVSTYLTAGAGGATVTMQVWVDGAGILGEPSLGGIVLGANQAASLSRTVRLNGFTNGLTAGLHTFALALAESAGSGSTSANGTRVSTTITPQD